MNARNNGVATGRCVRDAKILSNKDGSRKVFITIAVPCNYKGKDGKVPSDFISFEGFIPVNKATNGVYDYMKKGDLVSIGYTIRSQKFESNGETQYRQYCSIESVELVATNRANAAAQQTNAQAAQA